MVDPTESKRTQPSTDSLALHSTRTELQCEPETF